MQSVIIFLIILNFSVYLPAGIVIIKNYIDFPSLINKYLVKFGFCFSLGILYDFFSNFLLIIGIPIIDFVDHFFFCMKFFFFLLGIYYEFQLLFIFLKYMGYNIKYEEIIKISFLTFILILTTLAVFLSSQLPLDIMGLYGYKLNAILFLAICLMFIPIICYALFGIKKLFNGIKEKKTKNKLTLAAVLFFIITFERIFSIKPIILINFNYYNIIVEFLILLGIGIVATITLIKNQDMIESITSYFNVSSIYLIKNNGDLLFSHELIQENPEDAYSPRNLLLGGFIFAISQGIEHTLKVDKKIGSISLGKGTRNLIIRHGKHTIGVLFIKEASYLLEEKLQMFIDKFEILHKKELDNWRGKIADIRKDDLKIFIYDLFR